MRVRIGFCFGKNLELDPMFVIPIWGASKSSQFRKFYNPVPISSPRDTGFRRHSLRIVSGDRRKKNSVSQPGAREGEIRSIEIFRRVGEQIRFGKKNFIIINIYIFSGVATAERIRRMHDLKISHIQIINTLFNRFNMYAREYLIFLFLFLKWPELS